MRSRWPEGAVVARVALASGLVLLLGVLVSAEGGEAVAAHRVPFPARTTTPEPFGEPASLPTIDLVSRTVTLVPVTKDLGDAAEERPSGTAYDVRLNANVLFAKDSAVIRPQVSARLAQITAELKRRGPGAVTITGYTDDLGSEEHGLVLSRQRAAAVRAVLEPEPPGYRITSLGKGEADPLVPNKDETSRARNRRVEVHYEKS